MRRNLKSVVASSRSGEQRVAKGFVPVIVGAGDEAERFVLSVEVFRHPCIVSLLEIAAQEFGYQQSGVLRIPCDVQYFRGVLELIAEAL